MTKSILLQGVTEDSHLSGLRYLLEIKRPEKIVLCVAYMNENGVSRLRPSSVR